MKEEIKDYIKRVRKNAGLNTEKFGEKIGKSSKAVENWEQGLYTPHLATITFIEKMYGDRIDTQSSK